MESSGIDPNSKVLIYKELVESGGLSNELPIELIQEILLMTEETPRSEISLKMHERVVTIYKDKKLTELKEVIKNLITVLEKYPSEKVKEVVKDLKEYLEKLPQP